MDTPSERLAEAMCGLPYAQKEIAETLGFAESHLSAVKNGRRPLTEKAAKLFELTYGIRAEWLLTGEEPMLTYDPAPATTTTAAPSAVADVKVEKVYKCGDCFGIVEVGAKRCRHCGARLRWPHDTENGPDRD